MHKLITLGCSITQQDGWADYLSKKYNKELIKLAQGAGSNGLQVLRFRDYVLENCISPDDWIIWQITYGGRMSHRQIEKPRKEYFYYENWPRVIATDKNFFDKNTRYDLLTHEVIPTNLWVSHDRLEDQSNLLYSIISASKFTKNIMVFQVIEDSIKFYQKFKYTLDRYGIAIVDIPILDYVRDNSLPMADLAHPTVGSHEIYAEKVLAPKIASLGWQ